MILLFLCRWLEDDELDDEQDVLCLSFFFTFRYLISLTLVSCNSLGPGPKRLGLLESDVKEESPVSDVDDDEDDEDLGFRRLTGWAGGQGRLFDDDDDLEDED